MDWLRSVLAVVSGYAVMAAGVLLYFYTRHGDSLDEGAVTATPSGNEQLVLLGVGLVAATAGGFVCALLAPRSRYKHLRALAVLVVVMAVINALLSAGGSESLVFQVANAAVGVVGVFLGGSLRRGSRL